MSSPIHNFRVGVVNASAASHQKTLHEQQTRSSLLAKPEHAPQVVPATSLEGKNEYRLLLDWMESLEQPMTLEGGQRAKTR